MLTDFFLLVAKKEPDLIDKLNSYKSFSISETRWQFTLPHLFKFLQQNNFLNEDDRYDQFRKALFKSSINKSIKAYNSEITIENNASKVDQSTYKLTWNQK